MRALVLSWRMRHFSAWLFSGRLALVVIPHLLRSRPGIPTWWFTSPWRSGGTLVLHVGPLSLIARCW